MPYRKYLMDVYGNVCAYMCHSMLSMPSAMCQGALYTYLTCITEQIKFTQSKCYLGLKTQHCCTNMSQYNALHHLLKISFYHAIAIYMPATNMPLKCHIYAKCFMCTYHTTVSVYTSYDLNELNNVTRSTNILAFHITGICP